jgi:rod shape-determining protein MreC
MAVIVPSGILGRVSLVSERHSLVMTFLNTDFFVPAKVRPHLSDGIVHWSGETRDRLELEHVMKTEPVEDGQEVVTSGYSSVFRAGLPIGVVEGVQPRTGEASWKIFVRPHAAIDQIEHVFVLLEKADPERIEIQTQLE